MKILDYNEIKNDFNKRIFENSRSDLITKLSKYPSRYVGLFRPTKPYTKMVQNITQSHEIRFGDGFEILIRKLFEKFNFKSLDLNRCLENGNNISFDQLFKKDGEIIFIEQKLRDDHDSTKKRGQLKNFEDKIDYLITHENFKSLKCYMYFIDPSLNKNQNYYLSEIKKLKEFYEVEINLVYGSELFELEQMNFVWDEEIISFLLKWRKNLPDLPELNFDLNPEFTFNEIKNLSTTIYRVLFDNPEIINTIFPIIFPEGKTLKLLKSFFHKRSLTNDREGNKYKKLYLKLNELKY